MATAATPSMDPVTGEPELIIDPVLDAVEEVEIVVAVPVADDVVPVTEEAADPVEVAAVEVEAVDADEEEELHSTNGIFLLPFSWTWIRSGIHLILIG